MTPNRTLSETLAALRAELLRQHQAELAALQILESAIQPQHSNPPTAPAPDDSTTVDNSMRRTAKTARAPRAPRTPRADAAASPKPRKLPGNPARQRSGRDGRILIAQIIDHLPEPFTTADVAKAFLQLHPDLKAFVDGGSISPALLAFTDRGWLRRVAGGGPGNPSSYQRAAGFKAALESMTNDTARRYSEFRSQLQIKSGETATAMSHE